MTGYLYILKHGIGPGTMPKDVTILKEKDLPNYYTAVWLDRFLTTSELKQYDIPSETRINELLSRIDYCQADNGDDVVPCDKVTAAIQLPIAPEDTIYDLYQIATEWCDDSAVDQIFINNGTSPDSKSIVDENTDVMQAYIDLIDCIRNNVSPDILNEREYALVYGDEVEACDKVTASKIVASKMSDIDLLANEALDCTTKEELGTVISGLDSLGLRKLYLHYMEMLRDDSLSVGYIASDLSDTLYNMFSGEVNACGKVTASKIVASKMSDITEEVIDYLAANYPDSDLYEELVNKNISITLCGDSYSLSYPSIKGPANFLTKPSENDLVKVMSDLFPNSYWGDIVDVDACDKVTASKSKYFANMVSASEFDSFNDEYGVHRVSKSDLNYIRDSIYKRISEVTDIKFSIDMTITKQLPDAIAKVHITLRNLDDGTILEYDDRVDSNNLEGTIQRLTKFAKALITENWSEYPDNITDADEERITGDIYDEIETTIFDYYLYGTPELLTIYSEEDPTFLYNIETDYSDMPDSLTIDIKLEALDKDDLLGLVHDYLKPITKDYDPKYSIEHSKTGRTGKTGYIHIKFQ